MIPLKDDNPTRTFPIINYALIAANVAVFLYQVTLPPHAEKAFVMANAMVPMRIPQYLAGYLGFKMAFYPMFTSMFLHGGLLHLLGNMLFLYVFGDNVEDYLGHVAYLLFYAACGIGSGLIHSLFNLHSSLPALGASGAISGVMGAYAVLFPRARVLMLFFIFLVPVPAFFVLGYWFVLQFLEGIGALGAVASGGVAWWAHIGGFLMGMAIAWVARERYRS
ncbi:MAG TPA: rhomboid family intramembrane serine protease [Candidatus Acidoferrum sp.]|jgi:membrane associated rhomboid family serine protease|nr:rhomboid family intramembrane serine protease [Candidatus Acidoferrum sp.]